MMVTQHHISGVTDLSLLMQPTLRKEKTTLLSVIKEKLMVNLSFPLA